MRDGMMKQVVLGGDGQVRVISTEPPTPTETQGLVATSYSLISAGTERAALTGASGIRGVAEKVARDPQAAVTSASTVLRHGVGELARTVGQYVERESALGYSSAGIVMVAPAASDLQRGDRVACVGAGFANHAGVVAVPSRYLIGIPDSVSLQDASFVAPAAIALEGIRTCGRDAGERIAVLGLGLIGELTARLLSALGYFVVGFDISAERTIRIGASFPTVRTSMESERCIAELQDAGHSSSFDGVIVCASTGDDQILAIAAEMAKPGATISVVGDVPVAVPRDVAYAKQLSVRVSRSYGPGRHESFYEEQGIDIPETMSRWSVGRHCSLYLELLSAGRLSVSEMVADEFSLDEADDAYQRLRQLSNGPPAILLKYVGPDVADSNKQAAKMTLPSSGQTVRNQTSTTGRIGLAVVGAQGYARAVHLPILTKELAADVDVRAIVSRTARTAEATASRFGVDVGTVDLTSVLEDDRVEAVLVASSHASHHDIVLRCAEAGKAVFVEKPFDIYGDRAVELAARVADSGVVCRVGFNRRFAPAYRSLAGARRGPIVVTIRVNVPRGSGSQSLDATSSRIIGEAVHYFDFARFCTGGARPISVHAIETAGTGGAHANLSTTVGFDDGSTATVVYTTAGNGTTSKERVEIIAANELNVVQDFRTADRGLVHRVGGLTSGQSDRRGRVGVLRDFLRAVRGSGAVEGADENDGAIATVIADAALRSAATAEVVRLAQDS